MAKRKSESSVISTEKRPCIQSTLHKYFSGATESRSDSVAKPTVVQTPQSYDIHVYSAQEIEEAKGLEKSYREFWNSKATEICSHKCARSKLGDKVAIQGAINTSWILHKTNILKLKAEELDLEVAEVYQKHAAKRDLLLSSVHRNVGRMVTTTEEINGLYAEFEVEDECPDIAKIQDEITQKLKQFLKNQDSFLKALSRKKQVLSEAKLPTAGAPIQLSSAEIENIVQDVKLEEQLEMRNLSHDSKTCLFCFGLYYLLLKLFRPQKECPELRERIPALTPTSNWKRLNNFFGLQGTNI